MKKNYIKFAVIVFAFCLAAMFAMTGCGQSDTAAAPESSAPSVAEEDVQADEAVDADEEDAENPAAAQAASNDKIGKKKALNIALKDAGLTREEVTRVEVDLDQDDGRTEYDVEFHKGKKEYNYEIDAYSGKILDKDVDKDDDDDDDDYDD